MNLNENLKLYYIHQKQRPILSCNYTFKTIYKPTFGLDVDEVDEDDVVDDDAVAEADDDEVVDDEWLDVEVALAWFSSTGPIPAAVQHTTAFLSCSCEPMTLRHNVNNKYAAEQNKVQTFTAHNSNF